MDYDKDVLPLAENGNCVDRHLTLALALKVNERKDYERIYAKIFGKEKLSKAEKEAVKTPKGAMRLLRYALLKPETKHSCFVHPNEIECPRIKYTVSAIKKAGGIPVYPYPEPSEANIVEEEKVLRKLFPVLKDIGVLGVEIMTNRLKEEEIRLVKNLAHESGLKVFGYRDVNKDTTPFIDEKAPVAKYPEFKIGADFLVGHEFLVRYTGFGYYSPEFANILPDDDEQFRFFTSIGALSFRKLQLLRKEVEASPDKWSFVDRQIIHRIKALPFRIDENKEPTAPKPFSITSADDAVNILATFLPKISTYHVENILPPKDEGFAYRVVKGSTALESAIKHKKIFSTKSPKTYWSSNKSVVGATFHFLDKEEMVIVFELASAIAEKYGIEGYTPLDVKIPLSDVNRVWIFKPIWYGLDSTKEKLEKDGKSCYANFASYAEVVLPGMKTYPSFSSITDEIEKPTTQPTSATDIYAVGTAVEYPVTAELAKKEGRLFVIEDLPKQSINIISTGTLKEVTNFFCRFLGSVSKETKKNLESNLKDKNLREDLRRAFFNLGEPGLTGDMFSNRRVGVILEKKEKNRGTYPSFEEVFYCNIKKKGDEESVPIYIGLATIKKSYLNRTALCGLLKHKFRDTKRGKHIDPKEEVARGIISQGEADLIYELYHEISGIKFKDVASRSARLKIEKSLTANQVEKVLVDIFDLYNPFYTLGVTNNRFYSRGVMEIKGKNYPFFSLEPREYFFRAGNIFVVDSAYRDSLPKGLFTGNTKAVFLDFKENMISYQTETGPTIRFGTIGLLLALQNMDLADKVVLDAGTGDGLIGIAAALLGAKRVILLEYKKKYKDLVKRNAKLNNISNRLDYRYFGSGFKELWEKYRGNPKKEKVDIILSSLRAFGLSTETEVGPKPENYISMLSRTFPCKTYVAAGGWGYGDLGDDWMTPEKVFQAMGLYLEEIIEIRSPIGTPKPTFIATTQRDSSKEVVRKHTMSSLSSSYQPWSVEPSFIKGLSTQNKEVHNTLLQTNLQFISSFSTDSKNDALLRIPIEAINIMDKEQIKNVRDFLNSFQSPNNRYIELYYMSGIGEVSEEIYQKYGLKKKPLPKDLKRTRQNTITLFPAFKGEELDQATIRSRLGNLDLKPEDTILSPIGLQHDSTGLIRGTILGLIKMQIARDISKSPDILTDPEKYAQLKDRVQREVLEQSKNIWDPNAEFEFTSQDIENIIGLITGDINAIVPALNKLIKLLPITLIDPEELRRIFEHAAKKFA